MTETITTTSGLSGLESIANEELRYTPQTSGLGPNHQDEL